MSGVLSRYDIAAGMSSLAPAVQSPIPSLSSRLPQLRQNRMATNYTQPPPEYGSAPKYSDEPAEEEAQQPLLRPQAGPSAGLTGYYDQPEAGDVPDDFKASLDGLLRF